MSLTDQQLLALIQSNLASGSGILASQHRAVLNQVVPRLFFKHYIGEVFGGGVIFHLWKDENGIENGLIVDTVNLSTSQQWSNVDDALAGADSTWDGMANSQAIVNQVGHTDSAAKLCLDSTNGGFNDWYLPSVDEMKILLNNRFNVNKSINNISAQEIELTANYWASIESSDENSTLFNFRDGSVFFISKNTPNTVRAIRKFQVL